MSKVKSPAEKKKLSLERDRRNTYGENPQASRKGIAKGKQRRHMDERRRTAQVLARLSGDITDDEASNAELQVKIAIADSRNHGFRKVADEPLGVVLERKNARKLRTKT